MNALIVGLVVLLALAAPKVWARYVFYKHSVSRKDLEGTGGDLARELTRSLPLPEVSLKPAQERSHYNLRTSSVHLSSHTMNTCSLTALVRAAYEIGHAIQHKRHADLAYFSNGLLTMARIGERVGVAALLAAVLMLPILPPGAAMLFFAAAIFMITGTLVHLILLPVEWQASFEFAEPLLVEYRVVPLRERAAMRQLLLACTLSQFAYALANLLDTRHWLRVLGVSGRPLQQPKRQ